MPPGPLRTLAERLSGTVFGGKPRTLVAEVSDVIVSVRVGRQRNPELLADWLFYPWSAPPRRGPPLAESPLVKEVIERADGLGLVEARGWPEAAREESSGVQLVLARLSNAYDADALELAMRFVAAAANAPWPELALLRTVPGATPQEPDQHDLWLHVHEPEMGSSNGRRSVELATDPTILASVARDGAIVLATEGQDPVTLPPGATAAMVAAARDALHARARIA